MKKVILTLAIVLASTCLVKSQDKVKTTTNYEETIKAIVNENDSTPHIVSFYDVDRIVISNDTNVRIKIYDSNWKLLKDTTKSVNLRVIPGNYYVACDRKIKSKYVSE